MQSHTNGWDEDAIRQNPDNPGSVTTVTWESNYDHFLGGNYVVPTEKTLIIEKGHVENGTYGSPTVVTVARATSLEVRGTLLAIGDKDNWIRFESVETNPHFLDALGFYTTWAYILFSHSGGIQQRSKLRYCRIRHASNALIIKDYYVVAPTPGDPDDEFFGRFLIFQSCGICIDRRENFNRPAILKFDAIRFEAIRSQVVSPRGRPSQNQNSRLVLTNSEIIDSESGTQFAVCLFSASTLNAVGVALECDRIRSLNQLFGMTINQAGLIITNSFFKNIEQFGVGTDNSDPTNTIFQIFDSVFFGGRYKFLLNARPEPIGLIPITSVRNDFYLCTFAAVDSTPRKMLSSNHDYFEANATTYGGVLGNVDISEPDLASGNSQSNPQQFLGVRERLLPQSSPNHDLTIVGNVGIQEVTQTTARITWTSGVLSVSEIRYGTNLGNLDRRIRTHDDWTGIERGIEQRYTKTHDETITGLTSGTVYYFLIVVEDPLSHRREHVNESFTFTTAVGGDNLPPISPINPTPTGNSVVLRPTLAVESYDQDGARLTYKFFLKKETDQWPVNPTFESNKPWFIPVADLDADTPYKWYVIVTDDVNTTPTPDEQDRFIFRTSALLPPEIVAGGEPIPSSNLEVSALRPVLSIKVRNPQGGALAYSWKISKTNVFDNPADIVAEGQSDEPWFMPRNNAGDVTLEPNKTYYWQVTVSNGVAPDVVAGPHQFRTTVNVAPETPTDPIPTSNVEINVLSPTLSIAARDELGDVLEYIWQTAEDENFTINVVTSDPGTKPWFSPVLEYNKTYWWRVTIRDNVTDPIVSGPYQFRTPAAPENPVDQPPSDPVSSSPVDGRLGVPTMATLAIESHDQDGSGLNYLWLIVRDEDFDQANEELTFDNANPAILHFTNALPYLVMANLLSETVYFWRVYTTDKENFDVIPDDHVKVSGVFSFTTVSSGSCNPPASPNLVSPEDETSQPYRVTLVWLEATPGADGADIVYKVLIDHANPPQRVMAITGNTQVTLSLPPGGGPYFWKVIAEQNVESSSSSNIRRFSIVNPVPIFTPDSFFPAHGALNIPVETNLRWEAADPDGSPLLFSVYLGVEENPPRIASGLTSPSLLVVLQYQKTYHYRIVARDVLGAETDSGLLTFSTQNVEVFFEEEG